MYGTILTAGYAAGEPAAQAFQQVAAKGWNPSSSYGSDMQSVLRTVDALSACLQINGYIQ